MGFRVIICIKDQSIVTDAGLAQPAGEAPVQDWLASFAAQQNLQRLADTLGQRPLTPLGDVGVAGGFMGTKCNDCAIKNTVFSTHNLDHCIALRRPSLISNEAKRSCTYMRLLPKCTLKVQWLEHAKKEDQCRNFKLLGKVQRPKFNALKFYNQKFNLKSSMR